MLRIPDEIDATPVGSRLVLYHRSNRTATVLNPLGSVIWQGLGKSSTRQGLVDLVLAEFPTTDRGQVVADVETFVADLISKGLLESDQ